MENVKICDNMNAEKKFLDLMRNLYNYKVEIYKNVVIFSDAVFIHKYFLKRGISENFKKLFLTFCFNLGFKHKRQKVENSKGIFSLDVLNENIIITNNSEKLYFKMPFEIREELRYKIIEFCLSNSYNFKAEKKNKVRK